MTDNEVLLELQKKYRNGDKQALTEMYGFCVPIVKKIINSMKMNFGKDKTDSVAHDAATEYIASYLENESFEVKKNAIGFLYICFKRVCFKYKKKIDKQTIRMPDGMLENIIDGRNYDNKAVQVFRVQGIRNRQVFLLQEAQADERRTPGKAQEGNGEGKGGKAVFKGDKEQPDALQHFALEDA